MLQDSNATVANFFSFYGFRNFLHQSENDLFLRLHILDCGYAITCMFRKLDENVSPYGGDRCRLPINAGRALCVAFQSLYNLADDPKICPEDLEREVHTFARHCICAEHGEHVEAVHGLAERLLLAVERWQCRQVFMDDPHGPPSTPPGERPGASRLSQLFIRSQNRSPRYRPRFRNRFIDRKLEIDSWGVPEEHSQVGDRSRRLLSSPSLSNHWNDDNGACGAQFGPEHNLLSALRSNYQQFKGRARSIISKAGNNTRQHSTDLNITCMSPEAS